MDSRIEAAQAQLDTLLHAFPSLSRAERTSLAEQVHQISLVLADLQTVSVIQRYEHLVAQHELLLAQYQRDRRFIQITQQLRQFLDPSEILEQTVAAVQELLQVDRTLIYQFKVGGEATVVAEATVAEVTPAEVTPEHIDTLLNSTIELDIACALREFCQQVGAVVLDQVDVETLPSALTVFVQQQQATALLAAPIGRENRLIGVISAHHQTSSRSWQAHEIELLQQLSTEVAIALQHAQLYQQAQRLNLDLEQQVQYRTEQLKNALNYESMLKRITDRVRDSLDEHHILQAAVQELTLILGLAGCNAALYDLNQGTSTIHYEYTRSIPTSQGKVAQMEHFPEIYQQLHQGWYFQFCSLLPNPNRGRVAMLACPIFVDPQSSRGVDQSVLGDLWLIHDKDHMFDEHEIRLVQQVANQCAIAIRQARLYQAAQGQVQELAELNRLKDEFLSTVSHELRTPLTNIKMSIQMLRNSTTEDKRAKYLGILEQESVREADLINDLLDLQQLQAQPRLLELETLYLREWLPDLIEPFQLRFAARQQSFQADYSPDLPPLISEAASLRRILTELLNNACKYTAPGKQIHLISSFDQGAEPAVTRFTICNQTLIPEAELPKIFDKFYRCPNADPWKQGGTGLGLALVKKLVERLQGRIQVTSADDWTKFTVELPSPSGTATR